MVGAIKIRNFAHVKLNSETHADKSPAVDYARVISSSWYIPIQFQSWISNDNGFKKICVG